MTRPAPPGRLPLRGRLRPKATAVPSVTPNAVPSPMLETTREVEGYDGLRGDIKWWFESWGRGTRDQWTTRKSVARPPRPDELARADYITIGLEFPNGQVQYRTRIGGLDVDKSNPRNASNG